MTGLLVLPTSTAPAASIRSAYVQWAGTLKSLSARIPPNVAGHPGLKSNRSLIAVGTPCRGPSAAPDVTARSALRACSRASSNAVKTSAFRLGFRASMRAMTASTTSTGERSRRRMRAASSVARLRGVWEELASRRVFAGSVLGRVGTLVRTRTHLHPREPLRDLLEASLPVRTFAGLRVPFQCVAASIERAAEHWFTDGDLVDAVLASCAVPGLLPPVEVDGEHYLDGGLVHSIPVGRAVALGADTVYVLHVGRIDRPLSPPATPWEVALVAFEIARRHRFAEDLATLPPGVTVHVLPSGDPAPPGAGNLRYRDFSGVPARIEQAHAAARGYLDGIGAAREGGA